MFFASIFKSILFFFQLNFFDSVYSPFTCRNGRPVNEPTLVVRLISLIFEKGFFSKIMLKSLYKIDLSKGFSSSIKWIIQLFNFKLSASGAGTGGNISIKFHFVFLCLIAFK